MSLPDEVEKALGEMCERAAAAGQPGEARNRLRNAIQRAILMAQVEVYTSSGRFEFARIVRAEADALKEKP